MSTPIPVIETAKKIKQGEIPMDKKMRLREIARLAGGSETELALKRAEEIVSEAEEFKSKI